eukprot:10337101-Ditylum_brightwellii.AAC.1
MVTSSSDNPSATSSQPGGTLMAIGGDHMGRVLDAKEDKDSLGRWSWIELEGQGRKIYIATAYRVQQEDSEG